MKILKMPDLFTKLMAALVVSALWSAGGILLPMSAAASGQDVCNECHDEVVTAFSGSFHGRAWTGMGKSTSCQSCHGSADQHKDNPSKETIKTFGKNSMQTADDQADRCLACHSKSTNLAMWDMGAHKRNDVACVSCHDIHQSRSTVDQPTVCITCHREVRAQINKTSHHPIIEGKVKCSDCHNPHGSVSKGMLRAENINQLCYTCHPDKRGPFVRMHQPVEENCSICHAPHGSRHEKLLTQRITNLCQDCHADSGHHDNPYDATRTFSGSAPSQIFFSRSCLNCHSMIHGSTHFEQTGLFR